MAERMKAYTMAAGHKVPLRRVDGSNLYKAPCEKTCSCDPKPSRNKKCRVLRSKRIELTAVVTASALRGSMFKRNVYRDDTLSNSHARQAKCQHRRIPTVCSVRTGHCVPNYSSTALSPAAALGRRPTLASLSATRQAKRMLALVAELRGKCCLAPDPCFLCVAAATFGRHARKPVRRHRHFQPITTRQL